MSLNKERKKNKVVLNCLDKKSSDRMGVVHLPPSPVS